MVACDDMGVKVPVKMVTVYQKEIISKCHKQGKPIVVTALMSESMKINPRPTHAEVNDIYNRIVLSSDFVMLTAENANGLYPFFFC